MLHCALEKSGYLASLVAHRHQCMPSTPSKPWHIVMYSDEVTPGNQLAHRNSRKSQCIYWSFLELGPYLSNELCWFTCGVLRSCQCPSLSELYKEIVHMFFPRFSGGFLIATPSISLHLFATYGCSLADEGALHATYLSKGSAGYKCCVCCQNVFDGAAPTKHTPPPTWAPSPGPGPRARERSATSGAGARARGRDPESRAGARGPGPGAQPVRWLQP